MSIKSGEVKPLAREAVWYGDWGWTVAARERIGGKELHVISVQFSVSWSPWREPTIMDTSKNGAKPVANSAMFSSASANIGAYEGAYADRSVC